MGFLLTRNWTWLYWHQVITGWTALALLWAALVFSRQVRWRSTYLLAALFPLLWAYIAIYQMDNFLLAAGPAVLFLSLATLWTGWVFLRYWKLVGSTGAGILACAFILWSVHHLDYPFLRARGAWAPWGYYLDIAFALAVGAGIMVLVLDDLGRGLRALTELSGDLQRRGRGDVLTALLARPLTLPAVRGSALYLRETGRFERGAGQIANWTGSPPEAATALALQAAMSTGRPQVTDGGLMIPGNSRRDAIAYVAVLPVFTGTGRLGRPGPHRRCPRSVHRARRRLPPGAGPPGRRGTGQCRPPRKAAGAHGRTRPPFGQDAGAARRGAPPPLARVARRDRAGILGGQDGAGAAAGSGSRHRGAAAGAHARPHRQGNPGHPQRGERPPSVAARRPRAPARAPVAGSRLQRAERHPHHARRAAGAARRCRRTRNWRYSGRCRKRSPTSCATPMPRRSPCRSRCGDAH